MTGAQLLAQATQQLIQAAVPGAGRDARRLLAFALRVPAGRLTLFLPEPVNDEAAETYNALIARRVKRVPVSHLTGRRQFYGRDFLVTPDVLDPRPETETLIEAALAQPFGCVLDLGTGSGCILLTLLAETEGAVGLGVDISAAALEVAYWNRNAMSLDSRADLRRSNWFGALDKHDQFDLIVANPPYIAVGEMDALAPEVRDFEPRIALTDGADGLTAYGAICQGLMAHLEPGGRVLMEIGPNQAEAVSTMMARIGLIDVTVIRDLDDRDRVVSGRLALR